MREQGPDGFAVERENRNKVALLKFEEWAEEHVRISLEADQLHNVVLLAATEDALAKHEFSKWHFLNLELVNIVKISFTIFILVLFLNIDNHVVSLVRKQQMVWILEQEVRTAQKWMEHPRNASLILDYTFLLCTKVYDEHSILTENDTIKILEKNWSNVSLP